MFSITIRQHYQRVHKYVGYGICIYRRENGIYESPVGIKLYKSKVDAQHVFEEKVRFLQKQNKDEEKW